MTLTIDALRAAVAGGAVGVRVRTELEPLGGRDDKIAPPTYGVDNTARTKYAEETRRVNGQDVHCVTLNSVASQANAMEIALLQALRAGELAIPLVSTDFRQIDGLEGLERISALEAPHRVFDAILRDSLLGEDLFRMSSIGRAVTEATPRDAGALYRYSPTTLVFGGWDSTGPRGGRGSKYERALTSEIVGIGAVSGTRTASRLDPLGIEMAGNLIYEAPDGSWTSLEDEARQEKGKPVLFKGGTGEGAPGRPSQINHGNITPSLDPRAGGVTVDRIVATTVISFIQLRRLRFPTDGDGRALGDRRPDAEAAARTALAALALAAIALVYDEGFDLRSRCVLITTDDLEFQLVGRGSAEPTSFSLSRADALDLVKAAAEEAVAAGLTWQQEEVLLRPAPRLVELVRRSRVTAPAAGVE